MHKTRIAFAAFALLASETPANAPITRGELRAHCRAFLETPGSHGALACESFVQGYMEGLRSAARIEARPPDHKGETESWTDRAARTRLGRAQLRRLQQADHYCVPENAPVASIIRQLVDYLDAQPREDDAPAADALADTLRRHHACD